MRSESSGREAHASNVQSNTEPISNRTTDAFQSSHERNGHPTTANRDVMETIMATVAQQSRELSGLVRGNNSEASNRTWQSPTEYSVFNRAPNSGLEDAQRQGIPPTRAGVISRLPMNYPAQSTPNLSSSLFDPDADVPTSVPRLDSRDAALDLSTVFDTRLPLAQFLQRQRRQSTEHSDTWQPSTSQSGTRRPVVPGSSSASLLPLFINGHPAHRTVTSEGVSRNSESNGSRNAFDALVEHLNTREAPPSTMHTPGNGLSGEAVQYHGSASGGAGSLVNSWNSRCEAAFNVDGRMGVKSPLRGGWQPPATIPDSRGYMLDLSVTTWQRDSHDLFDYEANQDRIEQLKFSLPLNEWHRFKKYALVRNRYDDPNASTSVFEAKIVNLTTAVGPQQYSPYHEDYPALTEILMVVEVSTEMVNGSKYYGVKVYKPDEDIMGLFPTQQMGKIVMKDIYEIIRDQDRLDPPGTLTLQEDMVIKFGRFPVKVRQLKAVGDDPEYPQVDITADEKLLQKCRVLIPSEASDHMCRICLGEGSTLDDPLTSCCDCKGSIQFVHASCLRIWFLNSHQSTTSENEEVFHTECNISALFCELCKAQFPPYIKIPTIDDAEAPQESFERYDFTAVRKILPPFVVLESLQPGNLKVYAHSLVVPEDSTEGTTRMLKVGRGHESKMRIPDVSISRTHTEIRLMNDEFVLRDLKSKFGTLIRRDDPLNLYLLPYDESMDEIDHEQGVGCRHLSLQSGRSVVDCILRQMTEADWKEFVHPHLPPPSELETSPSSEKSRHHSNPSPTGDSVQSFHSV